MSIAFLTTILTILVLWKMEVLALDLSKVKDKKEEVLQEDELSLLIMQKYPKIGDHVEQAHELFDDAIFESESQIDFDFLNHKETIYVHFNPDTSVIHELEMYSLRGEINKIRLLGEKMLPKGFSFEREDKSTEERENKTFRYTETNYFNDYYYKLSSGEYALIQISNHTSDLVRDPDVEPPEITYTLTVSFVNDVEELSTVEETIVEETNSNQEVNEQNEANDSSISMSDTEVSDAVSEVELSEAEKSEIDQVTLGESQPVSGYEKLSEIMSEGNIDRFHQYLENAEYTQEDLDLLLNNSSYASRDRNNYGFNEFARLLLTYHANPDFTENQGDSALSYAVFFGNVELAEMLLLAGANKNHVFPDGSNLIDLVYSGDHSEMIELFEMY